ncbi:MAG: hypothetical protein QM572_05785 [Nocardioides sp.]|uniref:hypothetical protein n=1 Tax=Nocardioides sp. TaxID=35761 RepID=UPI0039E387CE
MQIDADGIKLLTENEASCYLDRSVRALRTFARAGDIASVQRTRFPKDWLYRLDVLKEWRDANGTYRDVLAAGARRTHTQRVYKGQAFSKYPEYHRWKKMMARCYDPNHPDFEDYGGRGIKVCEEWHDAFAFYDFVAEHMPHRKRGQSIDRINNDGHYEPRNVRWATFKEQNENRRGWSTAEPRCACPRGSMCEHDELSCPTEAFPWETVGVRAWRAFRRWQDETLPCICDLCEAGLPHEERESQLDDFYDNLDPDLVEIFGGPTPV